MDDPAAESSYETDNNRPVSSVVGLSGRCPRCGEGHLFTGYLKVADECDHCGLDFGFVDSADGPAVFVMLIVGFIVVGFALVVEFNYGPPLWVHAALWVPMTTILGLGLLRPLKGWLIAEQYIRRAEELRIKH